MQTLAHSKPNKVDTKYMLKTSSTQRKGHNFKAMFEILTGQREMEDSRNQNMFPPPALSHTLPSSNPTPQAIHRTAVEMTLSQGNVTNFFNEAISK